MTTTCAEVLPRVDGWVRRELAMLKLRFDTIKAEVHPPSAAITLLAT